jgi:hypothetical protein
MLLGDGLIIFAQLITAFQMVYEEHYLKELDLPPLLVVGWEGIFSFGMLTLFMFTFGFMPGTYFDRDMPTEALVQIGNSWALACGSLLLIVSMGTFIFAGMSITKEMAATNRVVLTFSTTLTLWIFSLVVGWQTFHWLQVSS